MDITGALPTFVVTLREGFEATLVVGIVLACLNKAQQTHLNRWVYQGIGGGIVASLMLGFFLGGIFEGVEKSQSSYTPIIREILVALFGVIAIIMLSWMLIWMTRQAKSMKSEVEGNVETVLTDADTAGRGISILVFIAILREGFETVLFMLAKFQTSWTVPALGAILGLITAVIFGFLLFKLGVKINLGLFFQVMGIFLILIVGGLIVGVLKHLDQALILLLSINSGIINWCFSAPDSCIIGQLIWDGSEVLPDSQFPGILLKSLFGYRQKLYSIQIVAYFVFLTTIGSLYFRSLQPKLIKPANTY